MEAEGWPFICLEIEKKYITYMRFTFCIFDLIFFICEGMFLEYSKLSQFKILIIDINSYSLVWINT